MSDKKRIYQALKNKNYFEHEKKDSLEVLEKASHLEDVIIKVERNCNVDHLLFRYDSHKHCFYRVTLTQQDEDLLNRERFYRAHPECKKRKCLSREIMIDEPLAIYEV